MLMNVLNLFRTVWVMRSCSVLHVLGVRGRAVVWGVGEYVRAFGSKSSDALTFMSIFVFSLSFYDVQSQYVHHVF